MRVNAWVAGSVVVMRDRLSVSIALSGATASSETLMSESGAHVVVLSTTVAASQAPYSLHSTYVGQRGEETGATHLLLAPGRDEAQLIQRRHAPNELPVAEDDRGLCLYDHLQELLASLVRDGFPASIDVGDQSIALINR